MEDVATSEIHSMTKLLLHLEIPLYRVYIILYFIHIASLTRQDQCCQDQYSSCPSCASVVDRAHCYLSHH